MHLNCELQGKGVSGERGRSGLVCLCQAVSETGDRRMQAVIAAMLMETMFEASDYPDTVCVPFGRCICMLTSMFDQLFFCFCLPHCAATTCSLTVRVTTSLCGSCHPCIVSWLPIRAAGSRATKTAASCAPTSSVGQNSTLGHEDQEGQEGHTNLITQNPIYKRNPLN